MPEGCSGDGDLNMPEEIDCQVHRLILGKTRAPVPAYSDSLDLAYTEVVTKMNALGYHMLLMSTHESQLCIASFYLGPHDRIDMSVTEPIDQPALAICRAALKRVSTPQLRPV